MEVGIVWIRLQCGVDYDGGTLDIPGPHHGPGLQTLVTGILGFQGYGTVYGADRPLDLPCRQQ